MGKIYPLLITGYQFVIFSYVKKRIVLKSASGVDKQKRKRKQTLLTARLIPLTQAINFLPFTPPNEFNFNDNVLSASGADTT